MSRKIESITDPEESSQSTPKTEGADAVNKSEATGKQILVTLHYPKPTPLSQVIAEVASWSEFNFVMEPSLNRKIQIFAPRKLSRGEAFSLFVASLETIDLRAIHLDGSVVKVVPAGLGKIAI